MSQARVRRNPKRAGLAAPLTLLPRMQSLAACLSRLSLDEHQRHVVARLCRATEAQDIRDQALHRDRRRQRAYAYERLCQTLVAVLFIPLIECLREPIGEKQQA